MEVISAHIWFDSKSHKKSCNVDIDVPGLGTVTVTDFLSDDTRARIAKEAIIVLKTKLGQRLTEGDQEC